jgi:hypothetical protein
MVEAGSSERSSAFSNFVVSLIKICSLTNRALGASARLRGARNRVYEQIGREDPMAPIDHSVLFSVTRLKSSRSSIIPLPLVLSSVPDDVASNPIRIAIIVPDFRYHITKI